MTQFLVLVSFFQWNNRLFVNCFQFFESGLVQIFVTSFGFNIKNFVNMGSGSNFCWRWLEKWLFLKICTKKFREINKYFLTVNFVYFICFLPVVFLEYFWFFKFRHNIFLGFFGRLFLFHGFFCLFGLLFGQVETCRDSEKFTMAISRNNILYKNIPK